LRFHSDTQSRSEFFARSGGEAIHCFDWRNLKNLNYGGAEVASTASALTRRDRANAHRSSGRAGASN
jgi:hypothetical protein